MLPLVIVRQCMEAVLPALGATLGVNSLRVWLLLVGSRTRGCHGGRSDSIHYPGRLPGEVLLLAEGSLVPAPVVLSSGQMRTARRSSLHLTSWQSWLTYAI